MCVSCECANCVSLFSVVSIRDAVIGIKRLGFEMVSRRFSERLGLEDITSRSRVSGFVTLGLVNIHAMHQACDMAAGPLGT